MRARLGVFLPSLLVAASAFATAAQGDAPALAATSPATRDLGGDSERLLGELTRERNESQAELERLRRESDAAHARTVARGRAYVRSTRAGLLPVAGGFEAFIDHLAALERLRNAISRDVSLEREISARRITLGQHLADLETRRSSVETEVMAMRAAAGALLSEQDRADAFLRAFSSSFGSSHTAVYGAGAGPSEPAAHGGGFAALKGRLPFPLPGRSEIKSGRRDGADGPGLNMFAPLGSVVRAVDAGRVAYADSYAAYGKTVILDHGGGYYTVSGNLGAIDVRVGDDVAGGARIGTVGAGASDAPHLYFEIRAGATTVAPGEWFGI